MSDRMKKLIEAGEVLRGYDIDLGRKLERERIIKLLIDENFFCNGHWHHECPDAKNCKLTINGGWHGKSPCELDFMGGSDCKRAIALIKGENE